MFASKFVFQKQLSYELLKILQKKDQWSIKKIGTSTIDSNEISSKKGG